jgi:hypothetical protein
MTIPTATEQPTVPVRVAAPWFNCSAASLYRAIAEGRAPCDVVHVGSRVAVVVASARRVLGLDEKDSGSNGSE